MKYMIWFIKINKMFLIIFDKIAGENAQTYFFFFKKKYIYNIASLTF